MLRKMSWKTVIISSTISAVCSETSTPAEKALPSALTTSTLSLVSPTRSAKASFISRIIAMLSTLRGGRSRVRVATPPSRVILMVS